MHVQPVTCRLIAMCACIHTIKLHTMQCVCICCKVATRSCVVNRFGLNVIILYDDVIVMFNSYRVITKYYDYLLYIQISLEGIN